LCNKNISHNQQPTLGQPRDTRPDSLVVQLTIIISEITAIICSWYKNHKNIKTEQTLQILYFMTDFEENFKLFSVVYMYQENVESGLNHVRRQTKCYIIKSGKGE